MEYIDQKHPATKERVKGLRADFNNISGTLDKARNAIQHADTLMEKVSIMGQIAKDLNMEDLDPDAFVRNIHLYVDDYLTKLDSHVTTMKRYQRL